MKLTGHLINGQDVSDHVRTQPIFNPATGQTYKGVI